MKKIFSIIQRQNEYFNRVVLTSKGFAVLNYIPEILNYEKSLGDIITDGVREGATDSVKKSVRIALSSIFYNI